jgi:hypothetical protein
MRGQQILYRKKELMHSFFVVAVKSLVDVLSPLVQLLKTVLLVAFFHPLFGFVQIGLKRDATNRLEIGWILLTSYADAQIHVKIAGTVFSHVFQIVFPWKLCLVAIATTSFRGRDG